MTISRRILGDFRTMDELKDALREVDIRATRVRKRSGRRKTKIVDKLVDANEFPGARSVCGERRRLRTAWSSRC